MNFVEFANPSGWIWTLLALPILLLYILKIRLRRQPVSTLMFWDQVFDEKKPRSWWQRLRHLLSLLLQLTFLALIVGALVDPLWSWQKHRQRRIVLIVDNSASMRTVESDGDSRLEKAKDSARALIRSLRGNDRMAILTAGGRCHVTMGMTDHQRSLLKTIDGLPPTDGPTRVEAAVGIAERLLLDRAHSGEPPYSSIDQGEIIVLSDGCFDGVAQLAQRPNVTLYGVGTERDNLGITRYQVRRSLLDAVGYQVLVDVTNSSAVRRSCRVELNLGDQLVDVVPMDLGPGETQTKIMDHTSMEGGQLVATLDVDDDFLTDNSALAVLPRRDPIPVLLVTEGNLFLQSVLASIQMVDLRIVTEVPAAVPDRGILVLDRNVPEHLPRGRVMVVDPQDNCDAWTVGEAIARPIVASVADDSPLTKHVRLDNVLFPDARQIEFAIDHEPLIQDPLDQPLLSRIRRMDGDVVVLTCSLEKGDLPLRIAFPVLMKNAVEWFQGNAGELRQAVSSGMIVSIDVPALPSSGTERNMGPSPKGATTVTEASGAPANESTGNQTVQPDGVVVEAATGTVQQTLALRSPSGHTIPIAVTNDQATIGPLLETGLWTLHATGTQYSNASSGAVNDVVGTTNTAAAELDEAQAIAIACNLSDVNESDLRPRGELQGVTALGGMTLGGRSIWFYMTLLATGLIVSEWWLYQRRIVG